MVFHHIARTALAAGLLIPTAVDAVPAFISPIRRDDSLKFDFGNTKIRGVNLGGWFVLEPWITPSIFEATPANVVDEWTLGQTLGYDEAKSRLEAHWSSWITEADFADMASKGLNFVRIPIGYWSIVPVPGDPYVQGAYDYLGPALNWAQKYGLKAMLDIHGAPGSQNGFDNSGRAGAIAWGQGETIGQTRAALQKLRDDFASHPAVAAIELVNEPMGPQIDQGVLRQYMMDSWGDLETSEVAITFHDAFLGLPYWNSFGAGMWALLLDTHHYEVFEAPQLQLDIQGHVNSACAFGNSMTQTGKWTISGEWTGAMTDCAQWLNGRGIGARYDGSYNKDGQGSSYIGDCARKNTGTVAGLSDVEKSNIKAFINAQMVAYEKANGWIFWAWKNEAAPEWHFQNLTNAGLVPQPLDSMDRSVCG